MVTVLFCTRYLMVHPGIKQEPMGWQLRVVKYSICHRIDPSYLFQLGGSGMLFQNKGAQRPCITGRMVRYPGRIQNDLRRDNL